jgi:hypothetical protein
MIPCPRRKEFWSCLACQSFQIKWLGFMTGHSVGILPHLLILYGRTAGLRGRLVVTENEDPEQVFLVSSLSEVFMLSNARSIKSLCIVFVMSRMHAGRLTQVDDYSSCVSVSG